MYDLDDACTGAQHFADTGKVDRNQLCIDGGSAGGYTTLAALTFRDVFKAGIQIYSETGLSRRVHERCIRYIVSPSSS